MNRINFTPNYMSKSKKAFTLIEILIVIGIIVLLMGLTTQMLGTVSESQGRTKAKADMALIATGVEAFYNQYESYPRINSINNERQSAGDLYKCLTGKMAIKIQNAQIMMTDVGKDNRPFVDVSKLTIADPNDPDSTSVDPEKSGVYFVDPWGNPYLYFYNTATTMNIESSTWRSQGFLLLSKGMDGKAKEVRSMYTTGLMPSLNDYLDPEENRDNIVHDMGE